MARSDSQYRQRSDIGQHFMIRHLKKQLQPVLSGTQAEMLNLTLRKPVTLSPQRRQLSRRRRGEGIGSISVQAGTPSCSIGIGPSQVDSFLVLISLIFSCVIRSSCLIPVKKFCLFFYSSRTAHIKGLGLDYPLNPHVIANKRARQRDQTINSFI